MTYILGQEKPPLSEVLSHYGVVGMKWGVRKRYVQELNTEITRLNRVATNRADLIDKIETAAQTPIHRLIKDRGIKKYAKTHAEDLKAHRERLLNGETQAKDIIRLYSHVRLRHVDRRDIDTQNKMSTGQKAIIALKAAKFGLTLMSTIVAIKAGGSRASGHPAQLKINVSDSGVTRKVKEDYNSMTEREFFKKYAGTKARYARRVAKYGDPYEHVITKHPNLV